MEEQLNQGEIWQLEFTEGELIEVKDMYSFVTLSFTKISRKLRALALIAETIEASKGEDEK